MFKHLFESMNETLDHIIEAYPASQGSEKRALQEQLRALLAISDGIIEEWLLFEEKMAKAKVRPAAASVEPIQQSAPASLDCHSMFTTETPDQSNHYQKGEGYFKLLMFREAAHAFQQALAAYPEYLPARLYLALSLLQMEQISEAHGHLQILISLTDEVPLKAVAYNALGCVQAIRGHIEKACECFRISHELDPNFKDPVYNLKACQIDGGVLQLGVAIG